MTIEELINCDASVLVGMSDEELLKHFEKYLPITRPEYAPKKQTIEKKIAGLDPKLLQASAIGKSLGINIDLGLLASLQRKKK
jgi:hypothetical protein